MSNDQVFWKTAGVSLALAATLATLGLVDPPRYQRASDTTTKRVWRTLHKDELNREARERNTAAYYEGLLNESSRVSAMSRLITGDQRFEVADWNRLGRRLRTDFRTWDLEPGFVNRDAVDPRADIVINSHGMADREYRLDKPAGVWRIALLGDSITRGHGAPMFMNYETLLEDRLNSARRPHEMQVEICNFAVGGYRITQLVDTAVEWAPPFKPDLYVLPLSELSVFRGWADHLTTLVQNGQDLKYEYLRQVVREAGIRPADPKGTIDAKLARFRLGTIEWAVRTIREQAAEDGAAMVIILLPNGTDPEILAEEFEGVHDVLRKFDVPVIDLLEAFALVENPDDYRVSRGNMHPNALGHQLLYEKLYEAITTDRQLGVLFRGANAN